MYYIYIYMYMYIIYITIYVYYIYMICMYSLCLLHHLISFEIMFGSEHPSLGISFEARFVVLGQYPRATGCIRVCQLCAWHVRNWPQSAPFGPHILLVIVSFLYIYMIFRYNVCVYIYIYVCRERERERDDN